MTEKEKIFLRKEFELKIKRETTFVYRAAFTALFNIHKKKNAAPKEVWEKPKTQKALPEFNEEAIETVLKLEKKNGKSWVEKVLKGGS